jgi:UDP-3-O-[3-hydroxymyristoyl] glucosamine N-acyltransferase
MKQTLRDLADNLNCRLLGDGSLTVTTVSSLQSATSHSLVFVEDALYLDAALRSSSRRNNRRRVRRQNIGRRRDH